MKRAVLEILSKEGEFLGEDGINNWALPKSNAIKALEQLKELGIPILGGDVLVKNGKHFSHNYDNWFFNISDSRGTWYQKATKKRRIIF